jgi:hypothetical protein
MRLAMKKIVVIIALILLAAAGIFAQVSVAGQTLYYKYVETVNTETGVRSKYERENIYLTFTQNSCYESDEKGIAKSFTGSTSESGFHLSWRYDGPYKYQGEENNMLIFMCTETQTGRGIYGNSTFTSKEYFYFSKDYKRMNKRSYSPSSNSWINSVPIYEQADPPKQGGDKPQAPDQLW